MAISFSGVALPVRGNNSTENGNPISFFRPTEGNLGRSHDATARGQERGMGGDVGTRQGEGDSGAVRSDQWVGRGATRDAISSAIVSNRSEKKSLLSSFPFSRRVRFECFDAEGAETKRAQGSRYKFTIL